MSRPNSGAPRVVSYPPPPRVQSHHPPLHTLHHPTLHPPPHYQAVLTPDVGSSGISSSKVHISPSVLVIVVILSVVLILSGFLHLLARCLGRRSAQPRGSPPLISPVSSLRGQLQHLFHLHDSGVEQAFIDTLPVFCYGSIRGLKDSADCAVCLTEFGEDDRLRLLPKCKHAFHLECIDTWLLSNSTCPLCRQSLLPEAPSAVPRAASSLESSMRERTGEMEMVEGGCAQGLLLDEQALRHGSFRNFEPKEAELEGEIMVESEDPTLPTVCVTEADGSERILTVELGKVKIDARRVSSGSNGTRRAGRSYSMGSYEYIVDLSNLELTIAPTPFPGRPQNWAPSRPTHRSALSDSIPELGSAGGTPANDDLFWASRGLYTPQSLSRVREIMTPSPGRVAYSPAFQECRGYSPNIGQELPDPGEQWIAIHKEEQWNSERSYVLSGMNVEIDIPVDEESKAILFSAAESVAERERESDCSQRSSSLRLPEGKASVSRFRRTLSETAGLESASEHVAPEVPSNGSLPSSRGESSKNLLPSSRKYTFNWLMGRDRRVGSAATPSPVDASHSIESRDTSQVLSS